MKNMEAEYDNSGRVENSSKLLSDYIEHAAEFRNQSVRFADFDQSYGPNPRNKLDLFWPGSSEPDKTAPIIMFIHGGYWQRLDRAAFSHMAKGLTAKGKAVAIPSYTLCPDIKISGIIDEIRRACIVLWKTYGRNITVCGHSAGGHLAACMLATNWNRIHNSLPINLVESALSISGVFDLTPLLETSHNNALKLTKEEARTSSPYNWIIEHDLRFDAWVGENESSEFLRQSNSQAQRWRMMGANTQYHEIPGANHFTAITPLTDPNSAMVKRLLELTRRAKKTTLDNLNIPAPNPLPATPQASSPTTPPARDVKPDAVTRPPVSRPPQPQPPVSQSAVTAHPTSQPASSPTEKQQEPPKAKIPEVQAKTTPPERETKKVVDVEDYKEAPVEKPRKDASSATGSAAAISIEKAGATPKKAEIIRPAPESLVQENKADPKETPQGKVAKETKADDKPKETAKPESEQKTKSVKTAQQKSDDISPKEPETKAKAEVKAKPKSQSEKADKTADPKRPEQDKSPSLANPTEENPKPKSAKSKTPEKSSDEKINFDGPATDSDNLTLISNIDDKIQTRLNELGFSTYIQVAELSQTQQEMIEDILGFEGQIGQEHWITQARHLIVRKQLAPKK